MTTAHETSTAFSDEVIKEHAVFELSKKEEMKDLLQTYADGQVEMLQQAMDDWDRVSRAIAPRWTVGTLLINLQIIPLLQRIRIDI